jgi:hypothetical protein
MTRQRHQPNGFDIRRRRRREVEAIAQDADARDTDDYPQFLVRWAQVLPESPSRMVELVQDASQRMWRRISPAEAQEIVEEARTTCRPKTPDDWARALGLTYHRRQFLGVTTIGSVDANKKKRAELRKLKKRQAEQLRRRAAGARPQSQSLSRLKPWLAEGISRRTWERRRSQKETP